MSVQNLFEVRYVIATIVFEYCSYGICYAIRLALLEWCR